MLPKSISLAHARTHARNLTRVLSLSHPLSLLRALSVAHGVRALGRSWWRMLVLQSLLQLLNDISRGGHIQASLLKLHLAQLFSRRRLFYLLYF